MEAKSKTAKVEVQAKTITNERDSKMEAKVEEKKKTYLKQAVV